MRSSFGNDNGFFRPFKIFFFLIAFAIIAMISLKVGLVYNSFKGGKQVYEIHVNSFNGSENYITTEFTKDEKTGCLTFKDELGIKRTVCNSYTITTY